MSKHYQPKLPQDNRITLKHVARVQRRIGHLRNMLDTQSARLMRIKRPCAFDERAIDRLRSASSKLTEILCDSA